LNYKYILNVKEKNTNDQNETWQSEKEYAKFIEDTLHLFRKERIKFKNNKRKEKNFHPVK